MTMDAQGRMTALRFYLDSKAQQDFRVFAQVDPFTVIMRQRMPEPARPNHILHLLLTVFTCGFWAIAWAIISANRTSERRQYEFRPWFDKAYRVHVDDNGLVQVWDDNAYRAWEQTNA